MSDPTLFGRVDGLAVRSVSLDDVQPAHPDEATNHTDKAVRELGAFTTPLLREVPEDARWYFKYEIIDGHRRIQSFRRDPQISDFEAMVAPENVTPIQVAAMRAAANACRGPNPLQEAQSYGEMIALIDTADEDAAVERISGALGLNVQTIRKRLLLMDLPASMQRAVREGRLAVSTAERLATGRPAVREQARQWLSEHSGERLTQKRVRAFSDTASTEELDALDDDLFDTDLSGNGSTASAADLASRAERAFQEAVRTARSSGISRRKMQTLIDEAFIHQASNESTA